MVGSCKNTNTKTWRVATDNLNNSRMGLLKLKKQVDINTLTNDLIHCKSPTGSQSITTSQNTQCLIWKGYFHQCFGIIYNSLELSENDSVQPRNQARVNITVWYFGQQITVIFKESLLHLSSQTCLNNTSDHDSKSLWWPTCLSALAKLSTAMASLPGVAAAALDTALAISISDEPPPNTVRVSFTVCWRTHTASCKERSASSRICCVAPRSTTVQASPNATPKTDHENSQTYQTSTNTIMRHNLYKTEFVRKQQSSSSKGKLWNFPALHVNAYKFVEIFQEKRWIHKIIHILKTIHASIKIFKVPENLV